MNLSLVAYFCVLVSTSCLEIESTSSNTSPGSGQLRGRNKNGAGKKIDNGRRVNQVYLEKQTNTDEIAVPSESIPLPTLSSGGHHEHKRELSFWSSILSKLQT